MPYLYAHTIFGLTVEKRVSAPIRAAIVQEHDAYLLGLIGPDAYFFDRLPPPLLRKHEKRTGNAIHNAPAERVFAALLPHAKSDVRYAAYALGFLCHYALDAALHPFVESAHRGLDHTRFEMTLELPFAARTENPLGGDRPLTDTSPHALFASAVQDRSLLCALDSLHTLLTDSLFSRSVPGAYRRSVKNFDVAHRLLYDPRGRKQQCLSTIERTLGKAQGTFTGFLLAPGRAHADDPFNESHAPWRAPWALDTARTESFFDLYESALHEADALLPLLFDAASGDPAAERALLTMLKGGTMAHGKPVR